ncbi:MAG: hypothetical protein LBS05_03060 [Tannerellaceae bacterium]|nr:hypothetical protein [Tannerellaceae bacterium]
MPELRLGTAPERYEVEVRGEYHYYTGDQTRNLFMRALLPFFRGKAGMEATFVMFERFRMTPETRDERHAESTETSGGPSQNNGDVVLTAFFQLLRSERWVDALFNFGLKTASGERLVDARFTDETAYWMDFSVGRDLFRSENRKYVVRMQAMAGFYCWMTNSMKLRQNDAALFGAGLLGTFDSVSLRSDLTGFVGYMNNGDRPLMWRNNLRFGYRGHILSLYYTHGMRDSLYDTYAMGYVREF